ncbi:MAG: energy transducer TonB [Pseudomonadota bacterium]
MISSSNRKTSESVFLTASVEFRSLGTKEIVTVNKHIKEESIYPSRSTTLKTNVENQKVIATDTQSNADLITLNIIPHPDNQHPIYPEEARQDGLEATCLLKILISPNGTVHAAEAINSSQRCPACFAKAAQKTLLTWRFTPQRSGYTERIVPIEFKLD